MPEENREWYEVWLVEGRYCHQSEFRTLHGVFLSRKDARAYVRNNQEPHLHLRIRKVEIE